MDFLLSEEQLAFQQLARQFAQEELAPYAKEWDEHKHFPINTLRKAAQLGLAGIYVRNDVAGSQLSRLDAALIFEELATACPTTAAYLSIHNMVAWLIDQYGNEQQRAHWLPKLMNMHHLASYCLTEPDSGSDAGALKTTAQLNQDHYILNGSKAFISGGSVSDVYACMVRTSEDKTKGISCILVEKGTPGLSFGKQETKLGWNSQPTCMVFFENCRVPVVNRIGAEGTGFKMALTALNGGRVNIAACSLGGARACLEITRQHLHTRKQFGQKLAAFQALQFNLANLATELEAARLMVYRAAQSIDQQHAEAAMYCAMAKRFATDIGFNITNQTLQMHGGYGYLRDYPIERFFRDLRVHQILEGTNEIMQLIIARRILDDEFSFHS